MSFRSSRPRLMMHVFFAPRPFLISLSSLSYDHPSVFFFRPPLPYTLHYRTSRRLCRIPPVSPTLYISFYSVLYVFLAMG